MKGLARLKSCIDKFKIINLTAKFFVKIFGNEFSFYRFSATFIDMFFKCQVVCHNDAQILYRLLLVHLAHKRLETTILSSQLYFSAFYHNLFSSVLSFNVLFTAFYCNQPYLICFGHHELPGISCARLKLLNRQKRMLDWKTSKMKTRSISAP